MNPKTLYTQKSIYLQEADKLCFFQYHQSQQTKEEENGFFQNLKAQREKNTHTHEERLSYYTNVLAIKLY